MMRRVVQRVRGNIDLANLVVRKVLQCLYEIHGGLDRQIVLIALLSSNSFGSKQKVCPDHQLLSLVRNNRLFGFRIHDFLSVSDPF